MTSTDDSVLIDCPAHPGQHWAALDTFPAETAGIWECPKGDSDSCEHEELDVEDAVYDYHDPGDYYGHGQREFQVYVCSLCGVQVEGDPAADRAADREDMAYDEWRDSQL